MSGYLTVGVLLVVGIALIAGAGALNSMLSPSGGGGGGEGLTTYESGVDPVGEGWAQSQIRYYVYAFLYVVFAVEAVFLFPWATILPIRDSERRHWWRWVCSSGCWPSCCSTSGANAS